jgi:6,7-dimethyl-8-ribityllumazine synthase
MGVEAGSLTIPDAASELSVAVLVAAFNSAITDGLLAGAIELLDEAHVTERVVIEVPGAFELPVVAKAAIDAGHDAVVALGAVVLGETDHYEHVAHRASEGLMRVALDTGVPVAFGILTARTEQQALDRSAPGPDNKGREAAAAALLAAVSIRSL